MKEITVRIVGKEGGWLFETWTGGEKPGFPGHADAVFTDFEVMQSHLAAVFDRPLGEVCRVRPREDEDYHVHKRKGEGSTEWRGHYRRGDRHG